MKSEVAKICPGCTFVEVPIQYADVTGGRFPSIAVSYFRSHPKINYAAFAFGQETIGLAASAAQAGLTLGGASGIQITGQAESTANLQAVIAGTELAWQEQPLEYQSWLLVDAMARQQEGMDLSVNWKTAIPIMIRDKSNTSNDSYYQGPTGYQDQFKKLWKVS